jgi:ribonucleoside-diphosphate reductase alpha chain
MPITNRAEVSMSLYQQTIHATRYARWREEDGRREYWDETCKRYVDYFKDHLKKRTGYKMDNLTYEEVYDSIYNLEVMPSMRTFMTAGKALESAEVANFNCAFLIVDHVRAFSEHMYVLMCGSGSGFSVERRFTDKLPEVPEEL